MGIQEGVWRSAGDQVSALRSAEFARPTTKERIAAGRAKRLTTPREIHASWKPAPGRPDPVAILKGEGVTRMQDPLPLRYGRMSVSPFTFYRGAAAIMASDLAGTPNSGL